MVNEENIRKIKGATAHESRFERNNIWEENESSLNYASCPEEYKQLIENAELDELVFWKLQERLENSTSIKQNEILKVVIADVERPLFAIVLSKTNGNQSKAAELLGCNRNTLHRKLKEFLINPRDIKKTLKNKSSKKSFFMKDKPAQAFKNSSIADSAVDA